MNKYLLAVLAILVLALSACQPIVEQAAASDLSNQMAKTEALQFDIAEDMNRFIFDQDVVYEDGMPADGSSFIARGYLYEYGTLSDGNGINPDGTPEFPEKVIGEWICQGTMINDAAHATTGVWVFSTQIFQMSDKPGAQTITTQGYELADVDVAIARAITGGTGEYSTARGESSQILLGLNASEGVNLRVQLEVQK